MVGRRRLGGPPPGSAALAGSREVPRRGIPGAQAAGRRPQRGSGEVARSPGKWRGAAPQRAKTAGRGREHAARVTWRGTAEQPRASATRGSAAGDGQGVRADISPAKLARNWKVGSRIPGWLGIQDYLFRGIVASLADFRRFPDFRCLDLSTFGVLPYTLGYTLGLGLVWGGAGWVGWGGVGWGAWLVEVGYGLLNGVVAFSKRPRARQPKVAGAGSAEFSFVHCTLE